MDFVLTFMEGFASFISPCMLPMLPAYLSYFAGKDTGQKTEKTMVNSFGFVLGFSIVFVGLSVIASLLGNAMAPILQYAKIVFGIFIILLGLNYMGVFQIHLLNQSGGIEQKWKELDFFKAILFGILFSISWTPCVGTFLSAALLMVAKGQNLSKGIMLILTYCLGLGIPFMLSALLIHQLKETFGWIKKHYGIIQKISGMILIVMGLYVMFF